MNKPVATKRLVLYLTDEEWESLMMIVEIAADSEPRRFVILDDSCDFGHLLPYHVKTTWEHGLLAEHVPLAIKILLEGP